MPIEIWISFFFASLLIDLSPGPAVTMVVGTTVSKGVKQGALSTAGIIAGDTVWFTIALIALMLSYQISSGLMDFIAYAGAMYLVWLGVSSLVQLPDIFSFIGKADTKVEKANKGYFLNGVLMQIANPKAYLYYLSIIPQFQPATGPSLSHSVWLLLIGVITALVSLSIYMWAFQHAKKKLANKNFEGKLEHAGGLVMICLGSWMLLTRSGIL